MSSEPALGIGELVVIGGRGQAVWEIVGVRHQIARVAARSIGLERGWVRSIPLE